MIDFLFYDFKFEREVVQEGTMNPAGTKWIRNDRAGEDKPSPKKQKTGNNVNQISGITQNPTGAVMGTFGLAGGGDQRSCNLKDKDTATTKVAGCSTIQEEGDEESEDEGLNIGDSISPGGQSFNFGSFQQYEIKKLWNVLFATNKSTAINEYGSNFIKSKFEPLEDIEAKAALLAVGENKQTVIALRQREDCPPKLQALTWGHKNPLRLIPVRKD